MARTRDSRRGEDETMSKMKVYPNGTNPQDDQQYYNLWRDTYEKKIAEATARRGLVIDASAWQQQLDNLNAWATERGLIRA